MPLYGTGQGFKAYGNMLQQQAATRLTNIEAQQKGLDLQNQMRMAQMLQRAAQQNPSGESAPRSPDEFIGRTESLANMAFSSGNVKLGEDLAKTSATLRREKASVLASEARQKNSEAQVAERQLTDLNQLLSSVHDANSFNVAKAVYMSSHPGEQLPSILNTYNPQVIETLRQGTKAGLDKLKSEAYIRDKENAAVSRADQISDRRARLGLEQRRLAIAEARAVRAEKVGGRKAAVVGLPNHDMIMAAQSAISQDYGELPLDLPVGKDIVSRAAYDVASEAKALMAANRGLSASEAISRAYTRAKAAGDFTSIPASGGIDLPLIGRIGGTKARQTYKAALGVSPDKPAPLPAEKGKLQPGRYYTDGKATRLLGKDGWGPPIEDGAVPEEEEINE